MKITTSYGSRNNDENYFVSFETQYDVQAKDAPAAINEMFQLAKEAIQKQTDNSSCLKEEASVNQFGSDDEPQTNRDGKITPKQIKFMYQLLQNNKKIFGDEASEFLRKEFQVKL